VAQAVVCLLCKHEALNLKPSLTKKKKKKKVRFEPVMVVQACNPSTLEAEAGGF
jgi:hypothetical protein